MYASSDGSNGEIVTRTMDCESITKGIANLGQLTTSGEQAKSCGASKSREITEQNRTRIFDYGAV